MRKVFFGVVALLLSLALYAQESVNSSGGNATGGGGSVAYSIGQIAYTTITSSSGSIAQGVQHAYEIYPSDINEAITGISLNYYPNPTSGNLTLEVKDYRSKMLAYQLYDKQGKLLESSQITEEVISIHTSGLPTSSYFINVINQENKKVQSFKIIKN